MRRNTETATRLLESPSQEVVSSEAPTNDTRRGNHGNQMDRCQARQHGDTGGRDAGMDPPHGYQHLGTVATVSPETCEPPEAIPPPGIPAAIREAGGDNVMDDDLRDVLLSVALGLFALLILAVAMDIILGRIA